MCKGNNYKFGENEGFSVQGQSYVLEKSINPQKIEDLTISKGCWEITCSFASRFILKRLLSLAAETIFHWVGISRVSPPGTWT